MQSSCPQRLHCARNPSRRRRDARLLELLPIRPLHLLPVDLHRLIPCKHRLDELLILRLARVQLRELVALVIRRDLKSRQRLLPTDEEGAFDDAVVGDAVDGAAAEEVLARCFQTREEAADQVGRHESHRQLVVVLVVDLPQAVLVELAVLPQPGKGDFAGFLVGVFALPVNMLAESREMDLTEGLTSHRARR